MECVRRHYGLICACFQNIGRSWCDDSSVGLTQSVSASVSVFESLEPVTGEQWCSRGAFPNLRSETCPRCRRPSQDLPFLAQCCFLLWSHTHICQQLPVPYLPWDNGPFIFLLPPSFPSPFLPSMYTQSSTSNAPFYYIKFFYYKIISM